MSEKLIVLLLNGWLVAAVVLFLAILVLAFRPGAGAAMRHNAGIPFADEEEERDGRA